METETRFDPHRIQGEYLRQTEFKEQIYFHIEIFFTWKNADPVLASLAGKWLKAVLVPFVRQLAMPVGTTTIWVDDMSRVTPVITENDMGHLTPIITGENIQIIALLVLEHYGLIDHRKSA